MKNTIVTITAIISIICLSACGSDKDTISTTDTTVEPVAEAKSEVIEAPVEEVVEEIAPEWIEAYSSFLSDHSNFSTLLRTQSEGGMSGYISGFFLYDMNSDDISELFVQKYMAHENIYTYKNGTVELIQSIMLDSFAETYFSYNEEKGTVYCFTADEGTGTDRGTGLSKLLVLDNKCEEDPGHWLFEVTEPLYSAMWGDWETEDGYDGAEWNEAVRNESSVMSSEEFYSTVESLNPFIYKKITDDNINKYVTAHYKDTDMYSKMSFDEYANMVKEYDESFFSKNYEIDLSDVEVIKDEDWNDVVIYLSIDELCCYPDSIVKVNINAEGEDWRYVYENELEKKYPHMKDEYQACFINIDDDNIPECFFTDENGLGATVMSIQNGSVITLESDFGNNNFSYKPNENIIRNGFSFGMCFGFEIFTLKSGEFELVDSYVVTNYDEVTTFYHYETEISEEEYEQADKQYGDFTYLTGDDFSPSIMEAKVLQ